MSTIGFDSKVTEVIEGRAAAIWAGAVIRDKPGMMHGDIASAIEWFLETIGQEPELIILNVKNERFVKEVPEGIKVVCRGGVLAGEVWLSATEDFGTLKSRIETQSDFGKIERPKIDTRYILHAGRPKLVFPVGKVQELASQGLGCRAIAKKLKNEGLPGSRSTVHRILSGQRVMV
jgi:hypothetical protein